MLNPKLIRIFLPFVMLLFLSSCAKDNPASGPEATVNEWIQNYLRSHYLWSDEARQRTPDYTSPERLFYSLLSPNDGKTRPDGTHYYYSFIEKAASTKAIQAASSYGFDFALYILSGTSAAETTYYARVLYVLPGTPAHAAGLKRGDWIFKIGGADITSGNYMQLMSGGGTDILVSKNTTLPGRKLTLRAAEPVEEDPLYLDTVLLVNDKKVGYLVYNKFKAGIGNNPQDGTYDARMMEVFKKFKSEGVSEFVLDLRYNGGGYLSCAQLLAAFLVPAEYLNATFCFLEDNKGKKEHCGFAATLGNNLDLSRVFVLTTGQTASASEAVINGLKPYMEVVQIGGRTEGKNVGSVREEYPGWVMQPIVSRISNASGNSDYDTGLMPEAPYVCDELNLKENTLLYEFGNRNEYMLAKALAAIGGLPKRTSAGICPANVDSRPVFTSLTSKQCSAVQLR